MCAANIPEKPESDNLENNVDTLVQNICLKCKKDVKDISYFQIKKCQHVFCAECLCEYLNVITTAKQICPFPDCTARLSDPDIRKCLSNVQLDVYNTLCLSPSAIRCLVNGCSYFVAAENKQGVFECPLCMQHNCLTCANLHRSNEPCGESPNKKRYEESGSVNLVKRNRENLLQSKKETSLTHNPEKSNCENCGDFLCPREGISIIPCFHNFCRSCLVDFLKMAPFVDQLKCLMCDTHIESAECGELLGIDNLAALNFKSMLPTHFHCQTPDCIGFWDVGDCTTFYKCTICAQKNCIQCRAVHGKMSCKDFRKTKASKNRLPTALENMGVVCYNCTTMVKRDSGCGAVSCPGCGLSVCGFTGKAVGPKGCGCSPKKRCHPECLHGCFPD